MSPYPSRVTGCVVISCLLCREFWDRGAFAHATNESRVEDPSLLAVPGHSALHRRSGQSLLPCSYAAHGP